MVSLSDIPCVGVAVERISEATVDAATRGLRYSLCYSSFVNQLNSEIENVNIQEVLLSRKVEAARNDGKVIEKHVVKWQDDVENIKTLVDELSRKRTSFTCFKVLPFPNLVSRVRLGRKAAHHSKNLAQLTVSGAKLVATEVGYLQAVENVPISNTAYHSFASRQDAYSKLWQALVDQNGHSILAIYGMPGVGKTRMMEQAWKDAKDNKIFDKVARVDVSGEKLNVINLQDKLASTLNCHLQSKDNEQHRASQLKTSLMNGGKTLDVLDDVWDVIPLNTIGIPFGGDSSKGCKILLTSRKQDVCLRNNCKDPIEIKTLTDGEAWEMFQSRVGGSSEIAKLNDASLAVKVCKKCAALPLLIDAVANALKCASENQWSDALHRLENHKFDKIEGIEPQVYAALQLSFEKLNVEARSCLFLCSMFPEDDDIEIMMLFDLATGCQLLERERNIDAVIDILKSSSLLVLGKRKDTVKLHDVIRDVARSIAARDRNNAFLSVRCSSRLPDNVDYHTSKLLLLDLEEDDVRFPDDHLVFPYLHTLWLRGNGFKRKQLSSGFFERFINIKFLVIEGMTFSDQQQVSIGRLEKLRMVMLRICDVPQTFISSISVNLETLSIRGCKLPSTLELPELKDLRKLELFYNSELNTVVKGISSLSSLEELKIRCDKFKIWGDGDVRSIFSELTWLTRFKILMMESESSSLESYPNEDVVSKLVKFNISVGFRYSHSNPRVFSKNIRLKYVEVKGWMALVKRAEVVELNSVKGLANGFSTGKEAFASLRELDIIECDNMKHVAGWEGSNQQLLASSTSFSNLTNFRIFKCRKLKYLFSASLVKSLQQMRKLPVDNCMQIEEIIRVEEGRNVHRREIICLPNLKEMNLEYLPNLRHFSADKVWFPNIEKMKIERLNSCFSTEGIELGKDGSPPKLHTLSLDFSFYKEVEFPSHWLLQLQNIEILNLVKCWWTGDAVFNANIAFFRRLRELHIEKCGVTNLFTRSSHIFLQQLEKLEVSFCPLLEEIIWGDDGSNDDQTTISLPQLQSLRLSYLNKLKKCGIFACNMPALVEVSVSGCGLSTLFTSSVLTSLKQLSELQVGHCPLLESIVEDEMHDQISLLRLAHITISLPRLRSLYLTHLPNLKKCGIFSCDMPALAHVCVLKCGSISTLFTSSAFISLQQLKDLQIVNCPVLESIVEDEMHDQTPNKTISLRCLKYISLRHLSRLKIFSSSSIYALYMPALKDVTLYNCPCMYMFSLLELRAPPLSIEITGFEYRSVSDLNRFI